MHLFVGGSAGCCGREVRRKSAESKHYFAYINRYSYISFARLILKNFNLQKIQPLVKIQYLSPDLHRVLIVSVLLVVSLFAPKLDYDFR